MRFLTKTFFILFLLAPLFANTLQAKDKEEDKVYAFCFSQNFNDTTLFLSAIQPIENAVLTNHKSFLQHRDIYSKQFKTYLESKYPGHVMSAIFFSTHVLDVAEKLCNKIAIIKGGKLMADGDIDAVRGDESLESVFMEVLESHEK